MKKPIIGITMGDPAGVGPELCLRALSSRTVLNQCIPVVFGNPVILRRVSEMCRLPFKVPVVDPMALRKGNRKPCVIDCLTPEADDAGPGRIQRYCGVASYCFAEAAILAAKAKRIDAVVTAPIHKESLRMAGVKYPGHTEMLADLTGSKNVCMMMASKEIKVSLVTTHVPYASVSHRLNRQRIVDVIRLTAEALKREGKRKPRITVLALNPHAGENGLFGFEERKHIEPAIHIAMKEGYAITGPLPPDTAFLPARRKNTDAYIAMYHDQGLIPFKMIAFETGVNITLGLPIIRTSVDHGTAFDIAWQGKASASSLISAIAWAVKLCRG